MTWKRLMESEIKDSGSMLPARMVLEHDDEKGTYWTYLESFTTSGETKVHYRQDFATEAEAVEDFEKRAERL